jgi:hypothetical protein
MKLALIIALIVGICSSCNSNTEVVSKTIYQPNTATEDSVVNELMLIVQKNNQLDTAHKFMYDGFDSTTNSYLVRSFLMVRQISQLWIGGS